MNIREYAPLGVASLVLFVGGAKYATEYSDMFIGAGFVILGTWLAVEIKAWHHRGRDQDGPKGDP